MPRPGRDAPGSVDQVSDPTEVIDNPGESRFELRQDGHLAELVYRLRGDRLVLIHTEVPPELEGRGLGGKLVTAAIARATRDNLTLVPLCPFANSWLTRHPEAASHTPIDWSSHP
jgi:predicted GNAT family acetyltransferase